MSARVINPVMLAEFTKIRSPAVRSHLPSAGSLAKIKKDLFGPVDKDDSKRFVTAELAKHQLAASKRWGFDFARGYPITETGQYIWERVPPTTIPEVYTLSRAAHTRITLTNNRFSGTSTTSTSSSSSHRNNSKFIGIPSMEDLLDERSERCNRNVIQESIIVEPSTSASSSASASSSCRPTVSSLLPSAAAVVMTTSVRRTTSTSGRSTTTTTTPINGREKRQPKITDYLKERKRLTPTKKLSPSKKTRNTLSLMLRQ